MATETNWVVITGPPSSGKTTLLKLFEGDGERVSHDTTRQLIADEAARGRPASEFRFAPDFQPRVLDAMASAQRRLDPTQRVFLEYALPCNIAFHRTEGRSLTPGLAAAAREYKYAHVFILDPVGWENDSQRVENSAYQTTVHQHMQDVWREHGYTPVRVEATSPSERKAKIKSVLQG